MRSRKIGWPARRCPASREKEHFKRLADMKVADINLSLTEIVALFIMKGHARLYKGTNRGEEVLRASSPLIFLVRFSSATPSHSPCHGSPS